MVNQPLHTPKGAIMHITHAMNLGIEHTTLVWAAEDSNQQSNAGYRYVFWLFDPKVNLHTVGSMHLQGCGVSWRHWYKILIEKHHTPKDACHSGGEMLGSLTSGKLITSYESRKAY